jgi:glycosidase
MRIIERTNSPMKTVLLLVSILGLGINADAQPAPGAPSTGPGSAAEATAATAAPWLLGSWVFDEEYTRTKRAANRPNDGAPEAAAAVAAQLLEKLKGAKVIVTDSEINMTRADGTGKVDAYTVMPSTDTNIAQLKQANGEVVVFHREGDRIWMASTGSANEPFYFKKAQ